jgi:hypothetical protein
MPNGTAVSRLFPALRAGAWADEPVVRRAYGRAFWGVPERHFEGGGRRLYIFSPGRLLACSIQETSWPKSRSSSSWMSK